MRFVTCVCASALSALFAYSAQAQSPPTVTFSASPTSIPNGQSSTLTWSSTNATACSGTGKGFSPSGPSGSICCLTKNHHHLRHHLHRRWRIGKSVGYGGGDRGADPYGWRDGRGYRHNLGLLNSNAEYARDRLRVARQPGRGHRRSSEQWVHMVAGSLQRRPYRVGLSERCRGRIANGAASLVQRESCEHPALASRRRFHGRRPTRLPAPEPASLHRAPQDLSPSRRLQPPFTASPAQGVADLQLNQRKWS